MSRVTALYLGLIGLATLLLAWFLHYGAAYPRDHLDLVASVSITLAVSIFVLARIKDADRLYLPSFAGLAGCQLIVMLYQIALPGFLTPVGFWFAFGVLAMCGVVIADSGPKQARPRPAKTQG